MFIIYNKIKKNLKNPTVEIDYEFDVFTSNELFTYFEHPEMTFLVSDNLCSNRKNKYSSKFTQMFNNFSKEMLSVIRIKQLTYFGHYATTYIQEFNNLYCPYDFICILEMMLLLKSYNFNNLYLIENTKNLIQINKNLQIENVVMNFNDFNNEFTKLINWLSNNFFEYYSHCDYIFIHLLNNIGIIFRQEPINEEEIDKLILAKPTNNNLVTADTDNNTIDNTYSNDEIFDEINNFLFFFFK